MELTKNDKKMISAINSNNIDMICKQIYECNFNINTLKKENIYLFDKNAIYLSYFRGFYYYWSVNNNIKAKKLMKYNNPFIFLFHYLGYIYHDFKKYNKAIYYLKRKKYRDDVQNYTYYLLYKIYDTLNKKFKSKYYYLRCKFLYAKNKIYYIFFILNKK